MSLLVPRFPRCNWRWWLEKIGAACIEGSVSTAFLLPFLRKTLDRVTTDWLAGSIYSISFTYLRCRRSVMSNRYSLATSLYGDLIGGGQWARPGHPRRPTDKKRSCLRCSDTERRTRATVLSRSHSLLIPTSALYRTRPRPDLPLSPRGPFPTFCTVLDSSYAQRIPSGPRSSEISLGGKRSNGQ